jgi:putative membrane protein
MNKAKLAAMAMAMLGAVTAQAQNLAKSDQQMLEQLAQGNMAEVEAGRIALQKSQNTEVRAFAQQMIDDHTAGLQAVQTVAQSKGVTLPAEPDARHKAMAAKLNGLSGDAFDRTYLSEAGVSDHKKTHALVQKVQANAKDADVQALGGKLEPTVAQHLTQVEQLYASVKGGTASGGSGTTGATGSGASPKKAINKADKSSSGNTDNPENPQNTTTHPPKQ